MTSDLTVLTSPEQAVQWLRLRASGTLRSDSRSIGHGDVFMAWPGAAVDGRAYVADAVARGAAACLVEQEGVESFGLRGGNIAVMSGLKPAGGSIAAQWFGHPTRELAVIAITGTNGKTSTAWWVAHAWNVLSHHQGAIHAPCAVVGTLGTGFLPRLDMTGMTTPDPVRLQCAFRQFVDRGAQACAIEASSIGLAEHRLVGARIRTAVFTNFTQDHLDYHGSMASYWQAKRQLFDWPSLQAAVINIDDPAGTDLATQLQVQGNRSALDVWTVSAKGLARIYAVDIHMAGSGLAFTVVEGAQRQTVLTQMVGHYNVLNLLGVIAVLRAHGCGFVDAVDVCAYLQPVVGRMQRLLVPGQPLVAVDYAHTPDALAQALQALRPIAVQRGGRLWCVFGCGGNRDTSKRPLMGAVAHQYADECIITSDNPRDEDPAAIAQQIRQGVPVQAPVRVVLQRAEAIAQALAQADAQDVIMLAGKGHEDYQEVAGIRTPFSDMQYAQAALAARSSCASVHEERI